MREFLIIQHCTLINYYIIFLFNKAAKISSVFVSFVLVQRASTGKPRKKKIRENKRNKKSGAFCGKI